MTGPSRPCPVCGLSDAAEPFAEENVDRERLSATSFASRKRPEYMHHRLERCRRCVVLFANPAPPPAEVIEEYVNAEYDSGEEARSAARTYAGLLARTVGRADGGALVDIGAGDGAFLLAAREAGYDELVGFEPSLAPARSAPPEIRDRIRTEPFGPGALEAGAYDVVTCFMTIEHVHEPLDLCREARRLLRPGGTLMIVCHDWQAPLNRLMGRSSPIFDIEHLQLLSRRGGERLLEEAGFADVGVRRFANRYPVAYWARIAPLPERLKERSLRLLETTGLGRLQLPVRAGNLLAHGRRPSA